MAKSSLCNHATRTLYRNPVDAKWHDGITSTESSPILHIQSDVIASTYDFLLTEDTTNLVQALKNIKKSKRGILKNYIAADEFTYVPKYDLNLRISIAFFDNKKSIEIKLFVQLKNGISRSLKRVPIKIKSELANMRKTLSKLEEDYKNF